MKIAARRVFVIFVCLGLGAMLGDRVRAPAPACPCSIWPPTATPANPAANDGQPIEVGTTFHADVDGFCSTARIWRRRIRTRRRRSMT